MAQLPVGIAGFQAGTSSVEQERGAQLKGILGMLQAQQSMQEQPLKLDLLRAQVADTQAKPQDRADARENTKQIALSRLQQAASQAEMQHQVRLGTLTNAQERAAEIARHNQVREAIDRDAQAIAGQRLFYDTGMRAPQSAAVPQAPAGGALSALQGRPPAELAAIQSVMAAGDQPARADVGPYNAGAQVPVSAPAPAAVPRAAPAIAPAGEPVPAAAVTTGPQMPTFGGSPRERASAENKWRLEQAKIADVSSPEAQKGVEFWTEVLQKGGSLPPGLARTKEGAALVKEVMKRVGEGGTKPIDLMANQAEFMGEKAGQRTLGTRTANIEMAATEAAGLSKLALTASDEWKRTGIKTLNDLEKFAQTRTASPELRRFVAANTSFINAYARAINPQGVGTVADKEHAREMLEVGFSKDDYAAAINQLQAEIRTAQQAPGQVKGSMRERFTGSSGDIGAQVRGLGVAYEPDKYEYRVTDGKVQRKAK